MPWSIKLHLMLGCTPATPEFPMLSVCNNPPHPLHSTAANLKFSFHCHPYPFLSLSIPSSLFLHFHSSFWVLQFDHLSLSLSLFNGLFLFCFSQFFLSCRTNKRAGMVRGLKLNKLCPTALNTQTGCSQNIKKPQTPKKRREAGLDKTIDQI